MLAFQIPLLELLSPGTAPATSLSAFPRLRIWKLDAAVFMVFCVSSLSRMFSSYFGVNFGVISVTSDNQPTTASS